MSSLKNNNSEVLENASEMVSSVKDEVAYKATQDMFENILKFDNYSNIAEDIAKSIIADLHDNSFMTTDLSLNDKQKNILITNIQQIVSKVITVYVANIDKHKRSEYIAEVVKQILRDVIDVSFEKVAYEVNRGTLINAHAVACDAKKDDFNKLELHYSKRAIDVAIPTSGIFISTNCIEVIKSSIEVDFDTLEEKDMQDKIESKKNKIESKKKQA